MSVKIYEAYRTPANSGLWPLLWSIKRRGQAEARARLAQVYRDIMDGRAQEQADWYARADAALRERSESKEITEALARMWDLMDGDFDASSIVGPRPTSTIAVQESEVRPDGRPSLIDVEDWAVRQYASQLGSAERSPWNLDMSISIRFYGRWAYLIPHCDRVSLVGGALNFLGDESALTDFAYWNNADSPDGISAIEWARRRKTWSELFDRWNDYVALEILSWSTFRCDGSVVQVLMDEYPNRVV